MIISNRNFIFVFMLRLVTHIERLLLTHDCVMVPELGGFVLQSVPAAYSAEEHIFRPMRKDLLFNSTLKHQDGLLAESYMKMYGVDFRKAVEMLGEDVEALRHRLNESGQIDMGTVGILRKGNEGQYVFTPSGDNQLSVSAYGLPSFYFAPLSLLRKEADELFIPVARHEERRKDAIYIRINRNVLRATTAVAAVAALVLLISTPVKDVNTSTYKASFIPTALKSELTVTEPVVIEPAVETASVVAETIVSPAPEAETPAVQAAPQYSGKIYYAIVGSFPNEEAGDKFIRGVDKNLYPDVAYVKKGDKVRVYANKFNNREDAEAYINSLRQTEKYKDAWLFISR